MDIQHSLNIHVFKYVDSTSKKKSMNYCNTYLLKKKKQNNFL